MFNKNKKAGKIKGFTLIELLIVMLIITVVGAISIPLYMHAMEKSRASEPISLLNTIANAEQRYKIAKQEYTDQLPDLDIHIEPYTQGNMTPSTFDTEYFDFTLEQEKAIAVRKEGADYTLAVDYETGEVTCAPGENRICTSLNLKAGELAAEPEPEPDPWKENACPYTDWTTFYVQNTPYSYEMEWNYRPYIYDGPTFDSSSWYTGIYDNTLDCIVGEGNSLQKYRDSSCLDSTTCEEYEVTDLGNFRDNWGSWWWGTDDDFYINGLIKRTCNKEAGAVECDEWTEVTELQYDEGNTNATFIKTCTGDNINQEDGTCLRYDSIYAVSVGGDPQGNYAVCNYWDEYSDYCYDWTIYDNGNYRDCYWSGDYMQFEQMNCNMYMEDPCMYSPSSYECCMYNPGYGSCDYCMDDPAMCGSMGGNPCDWDGMSWGENRSYECCSYDPYYDYEGCRWYRCDYWGEC